MNRPEIDQAVDRLTSELVHSPAGLILARAVTFLKGLQEETDNHSDGWSSWPLPGHAAAQLMGIRPDSMQAVAWAIAAGATGLAGALIATFFYIVPTVGETLGIVAFVTVSLGGFGSVPGALVAGLLIGVIESLSAYLIGPIYKDMVVYALFLGFLWFRPQGLLGRV